MGHRNGPPLPGPTGPDGLSAATMEEVASKPIATIDDAIRTLRVFLTSFSFNF
jgi:hypothetical protein